MLLSHAQEAVAGLAQTKDGVRKIRLKRDDAKRLMEEVLPLGHFGVHMWGDTEDILIEPVFGSQNYDAVVHGPAEIRGDISYVEVTAAREGEEDYLRMMVLEEKGSVPAFGRVLKKGTRPNIEVCVESMAQRHSDLVDRVMGFVEDAVARKREKVYPAETALLVIFDDSILKSELGDFDQLEEHVKALAVTLTCVVKLVVVGWSGDTFTVHATSQNVRD